MKKPLFFAAAVLCGAVCAQAQNYENGHEWVDLGLPSGLKWATMNVGADTPEAYGDYYAWGETKPKENYSWDTYAFTTDGGKTFTKYVTNSKYGLVDNLTTLEAEDDAASVNWGGAWRMPTVDEWQELITNCTVTWANDYNGTGVDGRIATSKANGNSIFFPVTGCRFDNSGNLSSEDGGCWSSSFCANRYAYDMAIFTINIVSKRTTNRSLGQTVRAVCATTATALENVASAAIYAENGRIVCDGDFRIYDLLGRDVTRMNGLLNGVYIVKYGEKAQKIVVR